MGDKQTQKQINEEEEDDEFLALRLGSQPFVRPRLNSPPPNYNIDLPQNPNSNHVQLSNSRPLYPTESSVFYSFNGLYGTTSPSSLYLPPAPPLSPPQPHPSFMFQPDMRSIDIMPQPQSRFHENGRGRPSQNLLPMPPPQGGPRLTRPSRRNPTQAPRQGKSDTVPAPFAWATTKRATVYSLKDLLDNNILVISGDVECKRCGERYKIKYNLVEKYKEVASYIMNNKSMMHDRAPDVWKDPVLPTCTTCRQENSAKPVIVDKKKEINWLFLFLGQMLGCCTLEQLKYFCKHTKNHRTGAKDRVIYLTYLCLMKQLDPEGRYF